MEFKKIALSAALAMVGALAAAQQQPDEVRFVILGDTQFANMGLFERMTHEINMLKPDYVTQVGDMIQGYTYNRETLREEWKIYEAQIEPLTMPFYPVPGNHDVVTAESEEIYAEYWGEDKLYYSYSVGPVHNIVLNTYYGEEDTRVAEWQRTWMAEDLAAYGEKAGDDLENRSIFVYTHAPLWRYRPDEPGKQDWNEVHEILKQYPVKLVVGGHTHEYVWEEVDGINYLVINSSGGQPQENERAGFFRSFLHVSVRGSEVSYAVVKPGSVLPLDTVNSEERSTNPRYYLSDQTVRLPDWRPGESFKETVTIPVSNDLDEPRTYRVDWQTAMDSGVTVEPAGMWLELGPGESKDLEFRLSADPVPAPSQNPEITITTSKTLRSGVVSREWEQIYRDRMAAAESDESIITTNIPLEETYEYEANYSFYTPPLIEVPRWSGELNLDGKMEEPAWSEAYFITEIGPEDRPEGTDSQVHVLWDDDYLYVGAWLGEPNPENLKADAAGDIPLTWDDDDFELFFDPENKQLHYSRLFQNVAGTRFNSYPRHIDDKYFESKYESAIHVGEDHWAIEMRIPWEDCWAKEAPQSGTRWGFNVGRHRQQSDPARWSWAGGLYDVKRYGILEFQ